MLELPTVAVPVTPAEGGNAGQILGVHHVRSQAMRRILATLVLSAGLLLGTATTALAEPAPPTEGGNGAGQSGQCAGPQDDRPSSCQSQGGPGNQP
jgi:hypothetical protein